MTAEWFKRILTKSFIFSSFYIFDINFYDKVMLLKTTAIVVFYCSRFLLLKTMVVITNYSIWFVASKSPSPCCCLPLPVSCSLLVNVSH